MILTELMWEPVLQDKRQEHMKFCKYAAELIELVSGKPPHAAVDPSLDRIRRVSIFYIDSFSRLLAPLNILLVLVSFILFRSQQCANPMHA
jgi:HIV-1 Vpr-binding protein